MAKAVIEALSGFPKGAVKTITCDRGSEFACWREIEKALHCDMYFADPYCAWQKGTNENLNGLLREFYPKGRNLSRVSPATLKKNLALINARPKKVLHFQTPQDLFEQNLLTCCSSFDNSSRVKQALIFRKMPRKLGEKGVCPSRPAADDLTKREKYDKVKTVMCTIGMAKEAFIWLSMNGKTASLPRTNG